jgi:hypothetical protein
MTFCAEGDDQFGNLFRRTSRARRHDKPLTSCHCAPLCHSWHMLLLFHGAHLLQYTSLEIEVKVDSMKAEFATLKRKYILTIER